VDLAARDGAAGCGTASVGRLSRFREQSPQAGVRKPDRMRGNPDGRDRGGRRCGGRPIETSSPRWMPAGVDLSGWNGDKVSGRRGTIIFTSAAAGWRGTQEPAEFKPEGNPRRQVGTISTVQDDRGRPRSSRWRPNSQKPALQRFSTFRDHATADEAAEAERHQLRSPLATTQPDATTRWYIPLSPSAQRTRPNLRGRAKREPRQVQARVGRRPVSEVGAIRGAR